MNLEIILQIIRHRWKQSLLIVCIATLGTGLILFLMTPMFRGTAVFTAANPNLGDRANIYRTQFWDQYFYFGSEFDNDRLAAIARSEELLLYIADTFKLKEHYKIKPKGEKGRYLTDKELKKNITIHKNEFGHIKVNVWDKDRFLAPKIANEIVRKVNETAIGSINQMKKEILQKLKYDYQVQKDSLQAVEVYLKAAPGDAFLSARKSAILEELVEKDKLIQQFNTSINNVTSLFIIEKAITPFKKEKPKILSGMITASIVSFVFSIVLIFLLEVKTRRKSWGI
ncbi:MAG: hypothetical protein U0T11_03080 [Chitinophagaceae bacterium]